MKARRQPEGPAPAQSNELLRQIQRRPGLCLPAVERQGLLLRWRQRYFLPGRFFAADRGKHDLTTGSVKWSPSRSLPGEKCLIAFPFSGPFGLGDLIAKAVERLGGIPIRAGFGQSWQELCKLVEQTQPENYIGFPVTLLGLLRMYGAAFPIRRALVSGDARPKGVMHAPEAALGSKLYPPLWQSGVRSGRCRHLPRV